MAVAAKEQHPALQDLHPRCCARWLGGRLCPSQRLGSQCPVESQLWPVTFLAQVEKVNPRAKQLTGRQNETKGMPVVGLTGALCCPLREA